MVISVSTSTAPSGMSRGDALVLDLLAWPGATFSLYFSFDEAAACDESSVFVGAVLPRFLVRTMVLFAATPPGEVAVTTASQESLSLCDANRVSSFVS